MIYNDNNNNYNNKSISGWWRTGVPRQKHADGATDRRAGNLVHTDLPKWSKFELKMIWYQDLIL